MKKIVVGFSVLLGLMGAQALAADLPLRSPPPVAPLFTWTGCYVGGQVGGGWGRETASAPVLAPGISVTGDTSGVIGGGQIGCNYQFAPTWVIGIEGDGSATSHERDCLGDYRDRTCSNGLDSERHRAYRLGSGSLVHLCKGWRSMGR